MAYNEKDIYKYISNYINMSKKTFIVLKDIYGFMNAEKPKLFSYINTRDGYVQLHTVIERLCEDNIISKTAGKDSNGMSPPLQNKYRKVDKAEDYTNIIFDMMKLNSKIDIEKYYLKNPENYSRDKKVISIISDYLDNVVSTKLTIHERSWQLFGDEKYLKNPGGKSDGEILLQNLGLTFNDLNCFYAYEPFIFFENSNFRTKTNRTILIIENKDTFWSFHNLLFDMKSTLEVDMIIYGEGNKINSSFQYVEKLGINEKDIIWYYGDIDREGLNIFYRLKNRYENYALSFMIDLYEALIDVIEEDKTPEAKNNQRSVDGSAELLIDCVKDKYKRRIQEIVNKNLYIPQEALNFELLCSKYQGVKD